MVSSKSCLAVETVLRFDATKSVRPRLRHVRDDGGHVLGQHRRQLDDLLQVGANIPNEGVGLHRFQVRLDLHHLMHFGTQERRSLRDAVQRHARQSLDDQAQAAVGELEHPMDVRQSPDGATHPAPAPRPMPCAA